MRLLDRRTDARDERAVLEELRGLGRPLETDADLGPLLDRIGGARVVLLGEASHGTHEYYAWRMRVSRRLIEERRFSFIAVEGDWPDCYRVNRYVKGYEGAGASAHGVLDAFARWPTWMWANREVVELAEWLEEHNRGLAEARRVGFYGLDVYSLWDSMTEVVEYLARVDPQLVPAAVEAYSCFDPYHSDEQRYARATIRGPSRLAHSCEDQVVGVLRRMLERSRMYPEDGEARLGAEQNARAVVGAERYYRTMVRGDGESWNIRDLHMADTLDRLLEHYGEGSRGIVWAHNTHIGDARATDMGEAGMLNLGQVARDRHGRGRVALVGFASHRGSVVAARRWGAPQQRMEAPEARAGSWEDLMHDAFGDGEGDGDGGRGGGGGGADRLLMLEGAGARMRWPRGHRAIGVVYRPELEVGNYVPTALADRYDALLYLDRTRALRPLHAEPTLHGLIPETYPSAV